MKKKTRKISTLTIQSLVAGVIILFFVQCAEDKTKKNTSEDSSLPVAEAVNETTEEAEKQDVSGTLNIATSSKEIPGATEQKQVDAKETVKKVKLELKATRPQVKKADKPLVRKSSKKESQTAVSVQAEKVMELTQKPKEEEILAEELKVLAEKVKLLEEKVKLIFEKLKTFAKNKEAFAEKMEARKAEVIPNPDAIKESQTDEEEAFKYPTHVFAGGFSTYEGWTGYGLQGSYAYRINNYFSLGVQGNAFFKDGKYKGDRSLYAGVRSNFHLMPLFVENSNFDLYAGGMAGACRDNNDTTFKAMAYLGVSYDFCKHWGIFAEAGNIGVFGLRLKF